MIDTVVDDLVRRAPVPAVGVAVFDAAGDLRVRTVYGTADTTTGRPAHSGSWWDLASLTKPLVTLPEVLALVDRGRLDLQAPLGDVWTRAAGHQVAAASIGQLLSHDAGLPAVVPFFRTTSGREPILDAALATALERPIGGGAVYSDLSFIILGGLVEELTGRSLADLASARTGLRYPPLPGQAVATERCRWRGRLIVGEVHDENAAAMGGVAGHAGGFGTLALVTAAARDWLTGTVVPAPLHQAATSCWATNPAGERFGLGWWLTPTRGLGGPVAGGSGYGCSGFVGNRVWLEPDYGYGVVVLSNRIHPDRVDPAPLQEWWHRLLVAVAAEVR